MTVEDVFLWLIENWDKIGVGILLITILYGGSRPDPDQWWVFGREFQDERRDKLEWKHIAIKGTGLAERGTTIAEKAIGIKSRKKAKK